MKKSFKDAAKKYLRASTMMFAFSAASLSYGGMKAYEYYSPSPHKTAYEECVGKKQACTAEQMALVKQHFDLSTQTTTWLVTPQIWLLMGLGHRRREKDAKKLDDMQDQKYELLGNYMKEQDRGDALQEKLQQTEAQLAPYLADEKRKTDDAAAKAAKQQLNDMAQDATTLQGQIKVGKKISIKQTPPAKP
ncbi:MAG: hypothetical protein ACAH80_09800 [Alphaproteobacteria bacterium]